MEYLDILSKKEYTGMKPGLDRIKTVLSYLGNPEKKFHSIHITGTNGKGSVAATLANILYTARVRTGLYTSPHLMDYTERIQAYLTPFGGINKDKTHNFCSIHIREDKVYKVNNHQINKDELEELLREIHKIDKRRNIGMTYFEYLTAAAYVYFAKLKVDIAVVEVGLGGMYDATNVIEKPLVTIITNIDYDHTDVLGKNILSIAREKTGIIKKQVPVVTGIENSLLRKYVNKKAHKIKAKVFFINDAFRYKLRNVDWENKYQIFDYIGLNMTCRKLTLPLLGKYQLQNASIALAAIELLKRSGIKIPEKALREGLRNVYWPGRFEIRQLKNNGKNITVILDGAHNPSAAVVLKQTLLKWRVTNNSVTFITGILKDKDYDSICKELSRVAKKVITFTPDSIRALNAKTLSQAWMRYSKNVKCAKNFTQAWKLLTPDDKVVCITGSLYTVSEAIKFFKQKGNN